jgi:hypothetical protein
VRLPKAQSGHAGNVRGSSLLEGRGELFCVGRHLRIDSLVHKLVTLVNQHRICVGWEEGEGSGRREGRRKMCQKNLRCLPEYGLKENSALAGKKKGWPRQ